MARIDWRGDAQAVQQRTRFTVAGTPANGDVIGVVVNGKEAEYTLAGSPTAAEAAAALAAAVGEMDWPEAGEFEIDYTAGDAFFDLVAATAGVPFTATATDTGTTTLTATAVTASKGPSHFDDPDNWTGGVAPTTGDSVVIARGAAILYGLGTLTADSVEVRASYTEPIGLPARNTLGYHEYRTRFLTLDAPTVKIGSGDGNGSPRLFLNLVAGAEAEVMKTASREEDGVPACELGAGGTVDAVAVSGDSDVGILTQDESTARTFTAVSVTGDSSRLTIGRQATVTALDFDRGTVEAYGTVSAMTMGRGDYTQHEGTLTAFTAYGGLLHLNHAGSTTPTCRGTGSGELGPGVDCEANNRARTFPNSEFTGGAYMLDENKSVTLTGAGTHTADSTFFLNSRLGPRVTWNRV